ELDRVLGGGFVPGSVVLIGGDPGAGKSTLLLQACTKLAAKQGVLYVTGEESLQQLALRAQRLKLPMDGLSVAAETRAEVIATHIAAQKPQVVVLDSVQVLQMEGLESTPGSVTQVRETAAFFTRLAKQQDVVIILVGHITKEGGLAGPKVLEHMIDCFMMLDSPAGSRYRTLRGHKNRFGAVNELGVFAMTDLGMKEVANPSAIFLQRGEVDSPGSVATVTWEGTRPLLVELQALVDDA
ncbi:MAG TPA: DNA repair protein RadA, partial [Gammaproteobacteria bacterium]|nr:DNA repair protein RadA [Gammaproteobacteria bacterium]